MFCPNCGRVLNDGAKFCGACGTPVDNAAAEFIESIENQTVEVVVEQDEASAADMQTPVVVAEQQDGACAEQVLVATDEQPQIASNETTPELFDHQPIQEQQESEAEIVEEAHQKKSDGVLKGMLASVYCVLIFIFLAVGISLLTARITISSENVKNIVSDLNSTTVEGLVTELNIVKDYNADKHRAVLKETFSESTIPDFIGEKLGEYSNYLLGGSKPEEIDFKDVSGLFEKNRSVAKMFFKFDNEDDSIDRQRSYERYYDRTLEPALNEFYNNNKINKTMDILRVILSVWVLMGAAVLMAALIAVLVKLKAKKGRFLGWLGWTFTVSGGLYLLAYITALVARLFVSKWGDATREIIGIVLESIAGEVVIIGGSILLVGILMIVIKKLISKRAKKA